MAVLFSLLFWFWLSSQSHFILRELLRDWSYKASDKSRCERYRTLLFSEEAKATLSSSPGRLPNSNAFGQILFNSQLQQLWC